MNAGARISLFLLLIVAGCEREAPAPSRTVIRAVPTTSPDQGAVVGRIRFVGTPPPSIPIITTDPCCSGANAHEARSIAVDANGGLAHAVVFIDDLPPVDGSELPAVLIDQVGCQYVPHVEAVLVNQTLRIRSSDETAHNVHFNPSRNPARNFSMTHAGEESLARFVFPEFIRLRCDVHPWMSGWIAVLETPCFGISGADGTFHVEHVPPGAHTLVVWQEALGRREQNIVVAPNARLTADFVLGAP